MGDVPGVSAEAAAGYRQRLKEHYIRKWAGLIAPHQLRAKHTGAAGGDALGGAAAARLGKLEEQLAALDATQRGAFASINARLDAIAEGVGAGGAAASAAASAEAKSARAAWAEKKPGSNASPKPPAPAAIAVEGCLAAHANRAAEYRSTQTGRWPQGVGHEQQSQRRRRRVNRRPVLFPGER